MAEKESCQNLQATPFPFDFVRSKFGPDLATILHQFEQEDTYDPHANFVTALNTVLVWTGARTATLPSWEFCDPNIFVEFMTHLNKLSRQVPARVGTIDEVIIVRRSQIYRSGGGTQQEMVTRRNCNRVRLTTEPPVGDDEIGRELDMYYANVDFFTNTVELPDTAFSIWEVGSEVLLYAEAWRENVLTPSQLAEFLALCEERLALWNSAMEMLDLTYRFYGTMDWSRSKVPWHEADKTKRLCGKEFLGVATRGKDSGVRVHFKFPSITHRAPGMQRSIFAAA